MVFGPRSVLPQDGSHHFHIHSHHIQLAMQFPDLWQAMEASVSKCDTQTVGCLDFCPRDTCWRSKAFAKCNIFKHAEVCLSMRASILQIRPYCSPNRLSISYERATDRPQESYRGRNKMIWTNKVKGGNT